MTHIASRGPEGFREVGRLHCGRGLEEQRCEDEGFEKIEVVRFQELGGECVETTCREGDAEHGAFFEEGFDAHRGLV